MNDTSTSPFIMGLLFVLRCLIPLGVLFGISYLLRRLELVIDHAEDAGPAEGVEKEAEGNRAQQQESVTAETPKNVASPKRKSGKKQKGGSKKTAAPKKKELK